MSPPLRLTIATPYLPYPQVPHGGGQDLFRLIEALSDRHRIALVSFVDRAQAAHAPDIRPYVEELQLIWPARHWCQRARRLMAALRHGAWHTLGRRAAGQMRQAIVGRPADVLHCAWTEMGRYLEAAPSGAVRVLDEVDVRFLVDQAAGLPAWHQRRRRREELGYCRTADLVLTRSQRDLVALQQALPDLSGLVLPPAGHQSAFGDIAPEESRPGQVLFVGAMDRARNQAAARWLVQDIWPLVEQAHPTARLRLVGANPPPAVQALARPPAIVVTGWVSDLAREYARARVVVAPMRSEAGALNKVLDGLAAGRPVVATGRANAGIGAPPRAICLADDAPTLAAAVVGLLRDELDWRRIGAAGRAFVQRSFDWPAAVAAYEAALLARVAPGVRSDG